jgi:hypothetical protein
MFRRSKRFIVAGLIAAGATTLIPAAPVQAYAPAVCKSDDVAKFQEYSHTALVTGQYTAAGAVDVRLTCGIVQNGVTVTRITDKTVGPAAAIAQLQSISGQWYTVCYDVYITYVDGGTGIYNCP